jgi:hypothetical protein
MLKKVKPRFGLCQFFLYFSFGYHLVEMFKQSFLSNLKVWVEQLSWGSFFFYTSYGLSMTRIF